MPCLMYCNKVCTHLLHFFNAEISSRVAYLRHRVGPLGVNHLKIRSGITEKERRLSRELSLNHTAPHLFLQSRGFPFFLYKSQIPLPLTPLWNQSQAILFIFSTQISLIHLHYCTTLCPSQLQLQLWPSQHPGWVHPQLPSVVRSHWKVQDSSSPLPSPKTAASHRSAYQTLGVTLCPARWYPQKKWGMTFSTTMLLKQTWVVQPWEKLNPWNLKSLLVSFTLIPRIRRARPFSHLREEMLHLNVK